MKYACGALPSPPDARDYKFEDIGGAAEVQPYRSTVPLGEIVNQLTSSQCGGCAGGYYRREREYVQNGHDELISHTYIYGKDSYGGEGMYARDLARILRDGVPRVQKWEHWGTKAQAQEIVSLYAASLADECHKLRGESYYFCNTWTSVLNAIRACNGCILMVACHSNWTSPYKGIIGKDAADFWGYHFVFAKDYAKKDNGAYRIRFVNSWGSEWGDSGCGYLDTDINTFKEAFAIVDNVNEVKAKLRFTDVPDDAWYAENVIKAVELGLMNGTGNNTFAPNEPVTRAQLATVLVRFAEKYGVK